MNGMKCQRSKESIKLDVLCYCVQYQDGQKRRKPNYSSVDLSEVEWEDKDDTVSSHHRVIFNNNCHFRLFQQ